MSFTLVVNSYLFILLGKEKRDVANYKDNRMNRESRGSRDIKETLYLDNTDNHKDRDYSKHNLCDLTREILKKAASPRSCNIVI